MDCESCCHLTVVGLRDTGPWSRGLEVETKRMDHTWGQDDDDDNDDDDDDDDEDDEDDDDDDDDGSLRGWPRIGMPGQLL